MSDKAYKPQKSPFRMKKAVLPLFFLCLLLLLSFSSVVSAFSLQGFLRDIGLGSLLGYDTVYKQNWGSISCTEGALEPPYIRTLSDQSSFSCTQYTDECRMTLQKKGSGSPFGFYDRAVKYKICDAGGLFSSNCGSELTIQESSMPKSLTLPYNKKIVFSPLGFTKSSMPYIEFSEQHRNFYIRGQENGKIYVQESCILNSDLKKRVLSDGLNELQRSGANQFQNYMIDFVSVASKTYSSGGQEVICQARQLYSVDQETFKDGSLKKIQGSQIKSVECCPGEANCNENTFTFVKDNVRECTYSSECPNGGNPIADTGTSYIKYSCQSGSCVQSASTSVECTNNAVCVAKHGTNSVCDLSPQNWGTCKDNSKFVGFCGDNLCESLIGETANSCPADCGPYKINTPFWKNPWFWALMIVLLVVIGGGTKYLGWW